MYLRWSWRGIRLILAMCVWFKMFYFWNWPLSKLHYFWSPGIPPQHTHTHTHTLRMGSWSQLWMWVRSFRVVDSESKVDETRGAPTVNCPLPTLTLGISQAHIIGHLSLLLSTRLCLTPFSKKKKGQSLLNVYFLKKKEKHAASSYHNK